MAVRRRSADEWRVIVKEWLASGMSRAEYARSLGVRPTTLGWWRWYLERTEDALPGDSEAPAFAQVVLSDGKAGANRPDFVIELDPLRVRVAVGFDAPELSRLLATLC